MSYKTKLYIRRRPRGQGWIAGISMPTHVGDKWTGWCTQRFPSHVDAVAWLTRVLVNHLGKRASYVEAQAAKRVAQEKQKDLRRTQLAAAVVADVPPAAAAVAP